MELNFKTQPQNSLKKDSNEMVKCACGCGRLMKKYDNRGRIRKYIIGHHLKFTATPFKKGHISWNKDKKMTKEYRKNISKSLIGNTRHLGKLHSKETRNKMSEKHKGKHRSIKTEFKKGDIRITGKNNPNWKGGITPENIRIRESIEYHLWREAVYTRDNFTCQKCGDRSGGNLNAHHIFNFANYPLVRTSIENGITFCKECHKEFHRKYGIKNNTQEQLNEFLNIC